jgi:phenylacetate-CoA ligase
MLPAWTRRGIVEPAWAAVAGSPLRREWEDLERSQYLPLSELRERQDERLRRLVEVACSETRFHAERFAERGISPRDISGVEDLRKLPVLTKRDIRTRGEDLLSRSIDRSALMEFRTGGSTGTPLVLFATEDVSERRNACARRSNRWSGWEVGEPVGAVWGNPKLPSTLKERLRWELLEPTIYLDTMAVTPDAVARFADEWRRVAPTLLFGHAHSLYALACEVAALGIDAIRPNAILSTSMMLLASERQVIESVFYRRVFDRYGCEEVGLIACECERHGGMHINADHLVVEFLRDDGSPVDPGETGFVVVTDLLNHAMPLIRYRVEDMAAPLGAACGCGRTLPLMGRVAGRLADFLVRRDGAKVAGVSLIENSLTKFEGLEQMQVVQDDLDRITLRVVPGQGYTNRTVLELTDYFKSVFSGAEVAVVVVDEIARDQNGKCRFAICKVPQ